MKKQLHSTEVQKAWIKNLRHDCVKLAWRHPDLGETGRRWREEKTSALRSQTRHGIPSDTLSSN